MHRATPCSEVMYKTKWCIPDRNMPATNSSIVQTLYRFSFAVYYCYSNGTDGLRPYFARKAQRHSDMFRPALRTAAFASAVYGRISSSYQLAQRWRSPPAELLMHNRGGGTGTFPPVASGRRTTHQSPVDFIRRTTGAISISVLTLMVIPKNYLWFKPMSLLALACVFKVFRGLCECSVWTTRSWTVFW